MRDLRAGAAPPIAAALYVILMSAVAASAMSPTATHAEDRGQAPRDTIEVASNPLEATSLDFARAVAASSSGGISSLLSTDGIRLQLDGPAHSGISSRQAVASLREFLRRFDGGQAFLSRALTVDGSADRAFAEILWSGRALGTSDEVHRTLFLGLVRAADDWRIDEIRLLR